MAKRSGVPASALRYYEGKGSSPRWPAKAPGAASRRPCWTACTGIALGQAAGFAPDEIRAVFMPSGQPPSHSSMLSAKADEIDRTVKRLKAMSDGLRMPRSARHRAIGSARRSRDC